jgi:hypothetical protein
MSRRSALRQKADDLPIGALQTARGALIDGHVIDRTEWYGLTEDPLPSFNMPPEW